ncbi:hypothetical protein APICC_04957 [Apis cerana cerana]|uniref:Uncharacterized protein n=1 Tax=Apis cerana cerana TaxID=94128 RepID=A0A2A3EMR2_APICC|nr:hypothetical protein APICC_04957 [Apis cerana cerana]
MAGPLLNTVHANSAYSNTLLHSLDSGTKEGQALSKKGDPKLSPLALYQPVFCKRRNQAPKEYTDQTEYVCPDRYESGKILIPSHEWESSLIKLPHMVKDWFSEINARKSICSLPLCIMSSRLFIFREITIALRSNKALNLNDVHQDHAYNAQCLV